MFFTDQILIENPLTVRLQLAGCSKYSISLSFFAFLSFYKRFLIRQHASSTSRSMASSPELLAQLKKCSSQSVVDALWVMGYPQNQIEGARPLAKGMKCVGNAVTVSPFADASV
jgi:hypothetical protein